MKVNYLGYYAIDKDKNLHRFKWDEDDSFYIKSIKDDVYIRADVKHYQILNIGYVNEL